MTNATSHPEPTPILFRLLDVALCIGMMVFSIAMGSVVGFMVLGQFVRMAGWALQIDWLLENGSNIGWLVGAGLGLAGAISKIATEVKKRSARLVLDAGKDPTSIDGEVGETESGKEQEKSQAELDEISSVEAAKTSQREKVNSRSRIKKYGSWKDRRAPSVRQFFFATGFLGFVGVFVGAMLGVSLCMVLISVTTSPFVPDSWRPKVEQVQKRPGTSMSTSHSNQGGTSFQHPLLGPIMIWSISGLTGVGLITGGFLSFFPEEKENSETEGRAREK